MRESEFPFSEKIRPVRPNTEIYVEKQVRIPPFAMSYEHYHTYCEIFYLRSGRCRYNVNGLRYQLEAGDLFIVSSGDPHSTVYEGQEPCERVVIYCTLSSLPDIIWQMHPELNSKLGKSGKVVLNPKARIRTDALIHKMEDEGRLSDDYTHDYLTLYLIELFLTILRDGVILYEAIRVNEQMTPDIETAVKYITANYALPITLESVAESISLSPTYLSRKFARVMGLTFKEYVNYIRIKQAAQMLLITDDSITSIATACGFNSSNYFKDIFRRTNGLSPREYRRQNHASVKKSDTPGPSPSAV